MAIEVNCHPPKNPYIKSLVRAQMLLIFLQMCDVK